MQAVRLGETGVAGDPAWKATGLQTGMASPLVYQGRIYAGGGNGLITCADAKTGKVLWKERVKSTFSASPVAGDGKVYFADEAGTTTVLQAGGDAMEVLATNPLGEEVLGTPALADGAVFIRTNKSLYCLGARK